jgi:hypothetical protein
VPQQAQGNIEANPASRFCVPGQAPPQPAADRCPVQFLLMPAEEIPWGEDTVDTIIDTFGLCSFDSASLALNEMLRACRPTGEVSGERGRARMPLLRERARAAVDQVLLLEHGESEWCAPLNWYLHWRAANHVKDWGYARVAAGAAACPPALATTAFHSCAAMPGQVLVGSPHRCRCAPSLR